jgi:hypothetical protein
VLHLLVIANVIPSSLTFSTLVMEEILSCETSVLTTTTQTHIPEDGIMGDNNSYCFGNDCNFLSYRSYFSYTVCGMDIESEIYNGHNLQESISTASIYANINFHFVSVHMHSPCSLLFENGRIDRGSNNCNSIAHWNT